MSSSAPTPSFQMMLTPEVKESIRGMKRYALSIGVHDRFDAAMRAIDHYLKTSPRTWGDPFRRFPGLEMVGYTRLFDELFVEYAVHESQPLVWLGSIEPVLSHPLCGYEGFNNE